MASTEGTSKVDGRVARWAHHKSDMLEAATSYALQVGVAELTLRPLAEAIGTSITSLNRQFGSKEGLVREVCQDLHSQMVRALEESWTKTSGHPVDVLRTLWDLWLAPQYDRQFAFLFELFGMAIRHPEQYTWFADSVVRDWMAPLEKALVANGHPADQARTVTTLVMAIIRGLRLDLAATGETNRVDQAYDMALALLEPRLSAT